VDLLDLLDLLDLQWVTGVEEATSVIYLTLNHCYITSDHHQKGSNTVHTIYPTLERQPTTP
jgi:hypothetical protein